MQFNILSQIGGSEVIVILKNILVVIRVKIHSEQVKI